MSHTPGPWITDPEFEHQVVLGRDGRMVADCAIFHKKITAKRCAANAYLVAAAPDLLEALEAAADEVIGCGGERRIQLDGVWLTKARAAIAKARGTSNEREQNGTKT